MVLAKMALLCLVPFWWAGRVPILLLVVVIASVGSHMPARLRYYSLLYRRHFKTKPPADPQGGPSRIGQESRQRQGRNR